MGLDLWLTVLGFPFEILKDLTLDKIEAFFEKIEPIPLQRLFIDSFYTSLDCQAKQYGRWFKRSWIKKLEKSIKKDETEFVKIFTLKAANYNALIPDFETGKLSGIVTQDIINRFKVEENFKDIMILIVQDCLKTYRAAFFKTMTEKQGIELLILLQGFNLETTIKAIESIKQELVPLFKEILKRESENDKESIMPKKKGKQIKILSITASPDDVDDIYYEKEQDTLLDAFRDFNRDEVYLDMPDPFKSTLDEIKERLKDGKHDILHITAHGGINDNGEGYLCFEDHGGKLEKVTGSQLAGVLKKLNPTPLIVILSSCHSARRESNLMPVARALYGAGIIAVIGMDKSISHDAAIDFNVIFFTALCRKLAIKVAFELGKTAILNGEQRRIKENPKWNFLKEYEIPQLLTRRKILNVRFFSDYRIEAPGRPQSHHFQGAKYLERGFIGRRQVLRDIFRSIENKQGAVVLKGPGGIGKSTLTTRAAANLLRKGYELIVLRGDTSEVKILEAISNKAAELGVAGAKEMYGGGAEPVQKLGWFVEHFLLPRKVMIIFDNFEENQDEERRDFRGGKETLKQFIWRFQDYLKNKESFLFFSTRCALPGFESPNITLDIPEFTQLEFRKMLWNGKALQRLDGKSIKTLQDEIGGNPRALDLLDRIAYSEFGKQDYNWEQLKDLIPELRRRIIEKKSESDDFTPLFLDKLIGYLTPAQRLILEVLSIYRNPVPKEAIEIQGAALARTDRKRLADLSLLECIEIEKGHLYYVHRLTAQYILDVMETSIKQKYHLQAAQYFAGINTEKGEKYIENDIEARWHYLQAGEWDRAAEITFVLENYLTLHGFPQRSMELLQELEEKKLDNINRANVYKQIGNLFQEFGYYEAALTQYQKSLEIFEKIGNIQGVSASLHNIGVIYQNKGDYEAALIQYRKSLEICEKIGHIQGVSLSLHQIGMIYQVKGDYEAALTQHRKSLEIAEKIGDIKGLSDNLLNIGAIYQNKGDYEAALIHHRKSLEISEKIGDIQGVSTNLHAIGIIYKVKGDYEAALTQYRRSLEIREKIGDIKGVSESLHQIGQIYQDKGEYDEALTQIRKSLEISEKIGDIRGVSASLNTIGMIYQLKGEVESALIQYRKSLDICEKIGHIHGVSLNLHQIGEIYQLKGDYEAALTQYRKSLEIYEKIGDSRGVSTSLHQIGQIYQLKGDYEAALTQYRRSLQMREKIGDIQGVSTSLHQIGQIYQLKGDYEAALTQYRKSLEIYEKIGDSRGVSISLHQIGRIYQEKGDYEAALTQYQKSLEINEKIGNIKGVSYSLHNIGSIFYLKGDYNAALTQYRKSLEIKEKAGDSKGVAISLLGIGNLYYYKNDYDAALEQYQKALKTFEEIGDIKNFSGCLHQIGKIYQDKGDYEAALTQYEKAKEIFDKIGDIPDFALTMFQMGKLYFEQNQFETTLKYSIQAFTKFSRIGSPYADQAKSDIARCREKMPEERFQALLKEFEIDPKVFDTEDDEILFRYNLPGRGHRQTQNQRRRS